MCLSRNVTIFLFCGTQSLHGKWGQYGRRCPSKKPLSLFSGHPRRRSQSLVQKVDPIISTKNPQSSGVGTFHVCHPCQTFLCYIWTRKIYGRSHGVSASHSCCTRECNIGTSWITLFEASYSNINYQHFRDVGGPAWGYFSNSQTLAFMDRSGKAQTQWNEPKINREPGVSWTGI